MQLTRKPTPLLMGIVILVFGGCRSTQQSALPGMNWFAKRGDPADASADYPAPSANAVPETVGSAEKLAAAPQPPSEYPATAYPNLPAKDSAGFLPDAVQLAQQAVTTPSAVPPHADPAGAGSVPATADVQHGYYQAQTEIATNTPSGNTTTWDEPVPAANPPETNRPGNLNGELAAQGPTNPPPYDAAAPRDAPWQSAGTMPPTNAASVPAANDYSWPPAETTAPAYAGPPAAFPVTGGSPVAQVSHESAVATPSHYEQLATQQAVSAGALAPGSTSDFAGFLPGNSTATFATDSEPAGQPAPFMPPTTVQNPAESRWE